MNVKLIILIVICLIIVTALIVFICINLFKVKAIPLDSKELYKDGYNTNMIVGLDQFGRTFEAQYGVKDNKHVGIFYFLWHGSDTLWEDAYNTTEILEQHGVNTLLFEDVKGISPANQPHYWGEPIWGYYNTTDEWVIRKQMELLTQAGIDFLVFDTTNAITYYKAYIKVLYVLDEMNKEGFNAPKIVFYTHTKSIDTIKQLYNELYRKDLYSSTWYLVNGKPLIIGYQDVEDDINASNVQNYKPKPLSDDILNFFSFRRPRWLNEEVFDDSFSWCESEYPQPVNGNMMSVSVASFMRPPFSFNLSHEGWDNYGRGYNVKEKKNVSADAPKGTFFQAQWNTVINKNPDIVFVTGWNEWIAWKLKTPNEYEITFKDKYMLVDQCNFEFSRDTEIMRGGCDDAFYIQLAMNIRKYKYNSLDTYDVNTEKNTIDIHSGNGWDNVYAVYRNPGLSNVPRDSVGISVKQHYTAEAARNNITAIKVAHDDKFIYFNIQTDKDINVIDDASFMNILIGTGKLSLKDWEGYSYVINRSRNNDKCDVSKLDSNGKTVTIGSADYTINGSVLQLKVERKMLKLSSSSKGFYFKVSDGVKNVSDIMEYYTSGSAMPMGHLSYRYYF